MLLKVVKHRAGVIGNDPASLHRPSHIDDFTSIPAQVVLQDGARGFGVTDVTVESAEGRGLMVDLTLYFSEGCPGSDR